MYRDRRGQSKAQRGEAREGFKRNAFDAIRSSARALFKVGAIDKATLHNLCRGSTVRDRSHDEAMAEMFKEDPAFAVELMNSILGDGDQADLQIAFRQMDKAGLFDRAGVLYEVACDVLGAIIAHYSEALAQERGKPVPDAAAVERIEAAKRAVRLERDELDASNAEAIKAVIRKYGPQARALYKG